MADQEKEVEKIERRLKTIELRLEKLESALEVHGNETLYRSEEPAQTGNILVESDAPKTADSELESQIGRFGLAWSGNIILLFGITILSQYLMNLGHRFIAVSFGYIAVVLIFFLAGYLKKTNPHLSFIFKIHAQILLYYLTLRLHFFSTSPVIPDSTISLVLLVALVALQVYISVRDRSQAFAVLSLIFSLTTAIVADSTHFTLLLVTLTAAGTVYHYYRFNWAPLLTLTIFLTYISFFLWLFGNPFMDHPMQMITEHHYGVIYLFGLGACFSIMPLFRKTDGSADDFLISTIIINGILFTLLLSLIVLRFFSNHYVFLFTVITVFCLIYSTILHSESDWNFASAFYALYGFLAMSIALYGLFGFPDVYLLLSVQSLIVVSMALWFRNKLIVIMNSLLFLFILIIYLLTSGSISSINFSFALIALVSARIINWKKSRLQIKTDLLRNLYLIEGFFTVLYALLHAVPKHFVTLSWTMSALLYFLLSFVLKNVKYRYMALGTMICASFYLFIVDLARIEIIYRVLALLFLAAISIGISIYYSNRVKKTDR